MFPLQNIYIKVVELMYYFKISAFGQLYYTLCLTYYPVYVPVSVYFTLLLTL